jgi:hypothetical protein
MKPQARIPTIKSNADLAEFVSALVEDLKANSESWENATLERYLAALASWLEDSDGYYENQGRKTPVNLTWQDVAHMLMAATMYE